MNMILSKFVACVSVFSLSACLQASDKKVEGMSKAEAQRLAYVNADHLLDGTQFEYFYKAGAV